MHTLPHLQHLVFSVSIIALWLVAGCGDEGGAPTSSGQECRLNSDCEAGFECVEGACVEATCEGAECGCQSDAQCVGGTVCEPATSVCVTPECSTGGSCALGEVCARHRCVVDVEADRDLDGVPDAVDVCPTQPDTAQTDTDGDGLGDACDPDDDGDLIADLFDLCPLTPNPGQHDHDGDGVGNACDPDWQGTAIEGQLLTHDLADPDYSGAEVFLDDSNQPTHPAADGRFVLAGVDNPSGVVVLTVQWTGFVTRQQVFAVPVGVGAHDVGEIELRAEASDAERAVTLLGRVALAGQERHDGVLVRARVDGRPVASTVTSLEGEFALQVGRQDLTLTFEKANFLPRSVEVVWSGSQQRFDLDGQPLAEAVVALSAEPAVGALEVNLELSPAWLPARERFVQLNVVGEGVAQSRAQVTVGEVERVGQLPYGTFVVQALREGFASEPQTITLSPATPTQVVTLQVDLLDLTAANLDLTGLTLTADHLAYFAEHQINLVNANLARIGLEEGADLSELDLDLTGVDLSNADLSHTTLEGLVLRGANLFGANLEGSSLRCADVSGSNLFGANLPDIVLDGADLQQTNLSSANMSGASLRYDALGTCQRPPVFDGGTRFNQADLSGATFGLDATALTGDPILDDPLLAERAANLQGVSFAGAIMDRTSLVGADLTGSDLSLTRLSDTQLQRARLAGASLVGSVVLSSDLTGADLSGANGLSAIFGEGTLLTDADFWQARMQRSVFVGVGSYAGASFDDANLAGAFLSAEDLGCMQRVGDACVPLQLDGQDVECPSFAGTRMQGANLVQADLRGIDFSGANLDNASMFEAVLTCTNLTDTSLRAAQLIRAELDGATLTDTNLSLADLSGVDFSHQTLDGVILTDTNLLVAASWEGATFTGATVCSNGSTASDPSNGYRAAQGDTPEVEGTCYHPVHQGTLLISTQNDADRWRDISGLTGSLIVSAAAPIDLDFYALESIGGDFVVNNTGLRRLGEMPRLRRVAGSLRFTSNTALETVGQLGTDPLQPLQVGGDVKVSGNSALTELDALSNLPSVGGNLTISSNAALTSLDGLTGLTSVGGYLTISYNAGLTNLDGLSSLPSVNGGLTISYNADLTNLDGLSSLPSVNGGLTIQSNAALTSLDGLTNLTSVGRDLSIASNAALTDLAGLTNITSVGGNLTIDDNAALTSLDGLTGLTSVGGYLTISNNAGLTNLDGLTNITSVGGLSLANNAALTSLDGLSSLASVTGGLMINSNAALTDLAGLTNLTSVDGTLMIHSNAALPACQAQALVDAIGQENISGTITLGNNTGGGTCP